MIRKLKLKDVGKVITGNTPSKKIENYYNSNDINFFTPTDFEDCKINELKNATNYISNSAKEKARILPKDSVLVTCIGIIGKVGIIERESAFNQQINAIIPNKDIIYNRYLAYWLMSKAEYLRKRANAPVVPIINKTDFQELEIDMPDMEIQKEITNKLDKIAEILKSKKQQIKQFDEIIKAQFVEMFESRIYPKEELGKLCDIRDGTHDSPKYLEKSEYKFITSKNIINNEINFSEVKYISKQDYDKFNTRSKVNYGDILMPMIGTIGKPMIVNIPNDKIDFAIKNVALIKFFSDSKVTNIYIKSLFDSDYFENIISQNKRGGTQKFIALSDIRKMKIEIPPLELQNQFAEIVKKIDKQKFKMENSIKEMEELYRSLIKRYFG